MRKDSERNDGPVHCLQKGSHDLCHVIPWNMGPGHPLAAGVTLAYPVEKFF